MERGIFDGLNPDEIRAKYRKLAFEHHPDRGGDVRTMQAINAAYHDALKGLHRKQFKGSSKDYYTYYYSRDKEDAVIAKLREVIALGMPDTVQIFLVGTWIWVMGTTKPFKDQLGKSGLGMTWNGKREAWQWHAGTKRRGRYNPKASTRSIFCAYGAEQVKSESRTTITH